MVGVVLTFESAARNWMGFDSCTVSAHVRAAVTGRSATVMVTPTAAPSFVAVLSPVAPAAPSARWVISLSTVVDAPLGQPGEARNSGIPARPGQVTQVAVVWRGPRTCLAT